MWFFECYEGNQKNDNIMIVAISHYNDLIYNT
jgi:hypothetical protein